jgi:hypothetical protein
VAFHARSGRASSALRCTSDQMQTRQFTVTEHARPDGPHRRPFCRPCRLQPLGRKSGANQLVSRRYLRASSSQGRSVRKRTWPSGGGGSAVAPQMVSVAVAASPGRRPLRRFQRSAGPPRTGAGWVAGAGDGLGPRLGPGPSPRPLVQRVDWT